MQGTIFNDYNTIKDLIENTKTKTGLKVKVSINSKVYEKSVKINNSEIDCLKIVPDSFLPKWNYAILESIKNQGLKFSFVTNNLLTV